MAGTRLRELKRRIASTRQIHQVTSALQRVAAARLGHDRQAIVSAQQYTRKIIQLTWRVCALVPAGTHPLMTHRSPVRKRALLAFGADRGLCGSFNTDLINELDAFLMRHPAGEVHLPIERVAQSGAVVHPGERIPGRRVERLPVHQGVAERVDEVGEQILESLRLVGRERGGAREAQRTEVAILEDQIVGALMLGRLAHPDRQRHRGGRELDAVVLDQLAGVSQVVLRARDPAGNLSKKARVSLGLAAEPAAADQNETGCTCVASGASGATAGAWVVVLLGVVVLLRRRAR